MPNHTPNAGISLLAQVSTCFILQDRFALVPIGYESFDLDSEASKPLLNSGERRYGWAFVANKQPSSQSLRMKWEIKDAGWPYARVRLTSSSDDPQLNTSEVELRWINCIGRYSTLVASAR